MWQDGRRRLTRKMTKVPTGLMSGPDSVARLIKSKLINANVFINRVIKHPKKPGSELGLRLLG